MTSRDNIWKSPAAIEALINATSKVYWQREDFKEMMFRCLDGNPILNKVVDWESPKVKNAAFIIKHLFNSRSNHDLAGLNRLAIELIEQNKAGYPNLKRQYDPEIRISEANESFNHFQQAVGGIIQFQENEFEVNQRKKRAFLEEEAKQSIENTLNSLRARFAEIALQNPQERGRSLEAFFPSLFEFSGIEARKGFSLKGEQIDGAFSLDGTEFIVELKWEKEKTEGKELRNFDGKLQMKLDNTLGLFFSMAGFTENAASLFDGKRPRLILMEGRELHLLVLENRMSLKDLIRAKKEYASHNGITLYSPDAW